MKTLFLKYFLKQKKFILFLVLSTIIATSLSVIAKIENKKATNRQIEIKNNLIEMNQYCLDASDEELMKEDYGKEEIPELREKSKQNIEHLKNFIKQIENNNWQFLYEYELDGYVDGHYKFLSVDDFSINPKTTEITQKTLTFLKENNIPSAHPLLLQYTEFDQPRTTQDRNSLLNYSGKTLLGTNHRLWDFFKKDLTLIYIPIIVLGTGTLFSDLYESKNKKIRFLKTSGVSNFKVVSSGLLVGTFFTVFTGIAILLVNYAVEFLINGSSSLKYPIVTYFPEKVYFSIMDFNYKIVPILEVLKKSIVLFLLYGIFIFLVTSFFSKLLKSTVKSTLVTFATILCFQIFPKYNNPFSYWKVGNLVDGSINIAYRVTNYSYNKSLKILLYSIFLSLISITVLSLIENRNFLKGGN